jgi:hypothetical protein
MHEIFVREQSPYSQRLDSLSGLRRRTLTIHGQPRRSSRFELRQLRWRQGHMQDISKHRCKLI